MAAKKITFPPRYYANCESTTLTVSIQHNVESVYFFYSNPVYNIRKFDKADNVGTT
jgi:hypothetical protein